MTLTQLADWATANDLRSQVGPFHTDTFIDVLTLHLFVGASLNYPSLLIYRFEETTDAFETVHIATISEEPSGFMFRTQHGHSQNFPVSPDPYDDIVAQLETQVAEHVS